MSEVLMIVFTAVIAAATGVYALLTRKLVTLNRLLVDLQTRPSLAFYLQIRPGANVVDAVLQNTGAGAARNITADFISRPDWVGETPFSRPRWLSEGLSFLAPGAKLQTMFAVVTRDLLDRAAEPVRLKVSYEDTLGSSAEQEFVLDLREFEGVTIGGKDPLDRIAESSKNLVKALTKGRRGLGNMPFVVAMSYEEYREYEQRVLEEVEARDAQHRAFLDGSRSDDGGEQAGSEGS